MDRVHMLAVWLVGSGCFTDYGTSIQSSSATTTGLPATSAETGSTGAAEAGATTEEMGVVTVAAEATSDAPTSEVGTSSGETTGGSAGPGETTSGSPSTDPSGPTTDEPTPVDPGCDPLDASLLACYRFEELGEVALDDSSYGHHAKVSSATQVPGKHGDGIGLVAASSVVTSSQTKLSAGDVLTLAAWIFPKVLPPDELAYKVVLDKKGEYRMVLGGGGVGCIFSTDSVVPLQPVPANAWTHVACVHEKEGGYTLYVDGKAADGEKVAPVGAATEAPLSIGNHAGLQSKEHAFIGTIDEVRIWGRSLSAEEVAALAQP